jgi:hypothetical protein
MKESFQQLLHHSKLNIIFLQLQNCMEQVVLDNSNKYCKIMPMSKQRLLEREPGWQQWQGL